MIAGCRNGLDHLVYQPAEAGLAADTRRKDGIRLSVNRQDYPCSRFDFFDQLAQIDSPLIYRSGDNFHGQMLHIICRISSNFSALMSRIGERGRPRPPPSASRRGHSNCREGSPKCKSALTSVPVGETPTGGDRDGRATTSQLHGYGFSVFCGWHCGNKASTALASVSFKCARHTTWLWQF